MNIRKFPTVDRLLIAVAISYFCGSLYFFSVLAMDDAFIHMRVARNWIEQGQPYFNPGEKVMGTSPHLWVSGLALLFWIFGPEPQLALILELIAVVGAFGAMAALLEDKLGRTRAILAALILTSTFLLNVASSLMETPLAMAFLLLSLLQLRAGREMSAGILAGIGTWVRYELALWSLLALIVSRDRRTFLKAVALPGMGLVFFCLWHFGTVIPQPMIAKPHWADTALFTRFQWFSFPDLFDLSRVPASHEDALRLYPNGPPLLRIMAMVALGGIVLLGAAAAWKRRMDRHSAASFAFSILLFAIYEVRGHQLMSWYWLLILIPFFVGIFGLESKWRRVALVSAVLATSGFWFSAGRDVIALVRRDLASHTYFILNNRTRIYQEIGADLWKRLPGSVVGSNEIGGLGWGFRGKVLDGMGQVSPDIDLDRVKELQAGPTSTRSYWKNLAFPISSLRRLSPDFYVAIPIFSFEFRALLEKEKADPPYRLLYRRRIFPEAPESKEDRTLWGSRAIEIYELTKSSGRS